MALPKFEAPVYSLQLPSTGETIKYRPFLVKEQRNLLMAIESDDSNTVHQCIFDILNNCTITQDIDVYKLPVTDIEYYFLQLRAKSVGEIVESRYRCNNVVEGKECGNIMENNLDITKIQVNVPENISPEIKLTDDIIDFLGGMQSVYYKAFKTHIVQIYNLYRANKNILYMYFNLICAEGFLDWNLIKSKLDAKLMNGMKCKDVEITLINEIESTNSFVELVADFCHAYKQKIFT